MRFAEIFKTELFSKYGQKAGCYINEIYDLVKKDAMKDLYLVQMREMAKVVYDAGLNIDYFPTNFIVQDEKIFYIDYECNNYMDEWNFENWGIKYWSKTPEFIDYMEQH